MTTAKITSKGQVTVPKQVRDELGLTPGSQVTFTRTDDGDYVLSRRPRSIHDLRGRLEVTGRRPRTIDEMQSGIERGAAGSDR